MRTYTRFGKDTWNTFTSSTRSGPVHLLNLIRTRADADYPDGRNATGLDAYREYSRISAPVLREVGGHIAWRGAFEMTMVGPETDRWDVCFIAAYPSVDAFATMMRHPTYREAMAHRQAGVEDSRLIRLAPRSVGDEFYTPA